MLKHPSTNLPVPLTSFIGREREIIEIKQLLATTRCLTLMGPDGGGKTRLALHVAGEVAASYDDDVAWVLPAAGRHPAGH